MAGQVNQIWRLLLVPLTCSTRVFGVGFQLKGSLAAKTFSDTAKVHLRLHSGGSACSLRLADRGWGKTREICGHALVKLQGRPQYLRKVPTGDVCSNSRENLFSTVFEGESLERYFSSVHVIGKAEETRLPHARNGDGLEIRGSPWPRISVSSSTSSSITMASTSLITIGLIGKEAMILGSKKPIRC